MRDLPPLLTLDGIWEAGTDRRYDRCVTVPGLAGDPGAFQEGTLWYRRTVDLPPGDWRLATLILNGARFCPAVHVDGEQVAASAGGMTVTTHLLRGPAVRPGKRIMLEIALRSLRDVDLRDASRIPEADLWRSNVSSCLWDCVRLRFHGSAWIARLVPRADLGHDTLSIRWWLGGHISRATAPGLHFAVLGDGGRVLAEAEAPVTADHGESVIPLGGACRPWRPEDPACYRLAVTLVNGGVTVDAQEITLGLKEFRVDGLGFRLNGRPVHLRAGTVVWHRWLRDPEARELAFDTGWFARHIVQRLKGHGANALRFHLGMPPEALLDLCDQEGLMVQAEWLFFHGMKASAESLDEQWRAWLDLCLRHPSVCLVHPWNETEGGELAIAEAALERLIPEYPPLVISHRDVIHIHKYWWSLFENVGLYYDSAGQFPKPIVADEFGGNYLDGQGDPGGYPALRESFLRFLGRGHTREMRLELQTEANARIAEYWRRLGAAGFSPFCALGSPEDGNHHFLGPLREARPKPVWEGLTAAYSPVSCSLEVWDRNFLPGQTISMPLHFFNDTDAEAELSACVAVIPEGSPTWANSGTEVHARVTAHGTARETVTLTLPAVEGKWRMQAILRNPPVTVTHPVVSSWRCRTFSVKVPPLLRRLKIGVPDDEPELRAFLDAYDLVSCRIDAPEAVVVITSAATWQRLANDERLKADLEDAIRRGCSLVMLDIGPVLLGQGYLPGKDLGPLQGGRSVPNPRVWEAGLFRGVRLIFRELPEPESCLHPAVADDSLWEHLEPQYTWLWNGLRGGLIVPAVDMEPVGLSPAAFVALWSSRGADPALLGQRDYYAYELAGFYAFSAVPDGEAERVLRAKVRFLVEDAPALAVSIDPEAPVKAIDLAHLYRLSQAGEATKLTALASCGKNLARAPVVRIDFAPGMGSLLLSQLLTKGRLAEGFGEPGLYGIRYDPVAVQFVLNMLHRSLGA